MEDNSPEVLNEEEEQVLQENGCGDDDDDPEMNNIQLLLGTEINPVLNDQQAARIINDIWTREVRTRALQYIVRTGQQLRVSVRTIYISVVYFDRYLASRIINVRKDLIPLKMVVLYFYFYLIGLFSDTTKYWKVMLIAVSCLSLSAQMEVNVPLLSEYPLGNWNLNVHDIRRMVVLVQNVFNWNMNFVTPFPFALFFLSRFNRQISEATRRKTTEIIMSVFRDVRLMNDQRSSVIAVAAIFLAVNNNLTRQELEIEIHALPLNGFLNIDNVWYCYNRL